jgi:hypothetical protein
VVFSTTVAQAMIGEENIDWDIAALMFLLRRGDFSDMLANSGFAAI